MLSNSVHLAQRGAALQDDVELLALHGGKLAELADGHLGVLRLHGGGNVRRRSDCS